MLDKNGVEIQTGAIVEITGAYFKSDNGLYFVAHSPGDPGWSGADHSLHKISKYGKVSTAKNNVGFWPIYITVSSFEKRWCARVWNEKNAQIEVKKDLPDMGGVYDYFAGKADSVEAEAKRMACRFGEDTAAYQKAKMIADHYRAVANRVIRRKEGRTA